MRSRSLCTMSNCRRSVLFVWVASLVLACPIIKVMEMHSVLYTNPTRTVWLKAHYCKPMDSLIFLTYQLLVLFAVPAVLMIIFYAVVIRVLWKSTKNIKALTNSSRSASAENYHLMVAGGETLSVGRVHVGGMNMRNGGLSGGESTYNSSASLYVPYNANRSRTPSPSAARHMPPKKHREKGEDVKKARKQVIKMLIVVVVLFLLCWGPRIIMEICINLGLQQFTQVFYNFKIVFILLPFIHCCINPIIYCFMSKNFRRSTKRMLRGFCAPCRRRCCFPRRRPPPRTLLNRVLTRSVYSSYSGEVTTRQTDMETISSL